MKRNLVIMAGVLLIGSAGIAASAPQYRMYDAQKMVRVNGVLCTNFNDGSQEVCLVGVEDFSCEAPVKSAPKFTATATNAPTQIVPTETPQIKTVPETPVPPATPMPPVTPDAEKGNQGKGNWVDPQAPGCVGKTNPGCHNDDPPIIKGGGDKK